MKTTEIKVYKDSFIEQVAIQLQALNLGAMVTVTDFTINTKRSSAALRTLAEKGILQRVRIMQHGGTKVVQYKYISVPVIANTGTSRGKYETTENKYSLPFIGGVFADMFRPFPIPKNAGVIYGMRE